MKLKSIVLALSLASGSAFAATMAGTTAVAVCTGVTGDNVAIVAAPTVSTGGFIQEDFNQGCSSNVYLSVAETATSAYGASYSKKGKKYMIGNTNGGAPRADGDLPTTVPAAVPAIQMTNAAALGS